MDVNVVEVVGGAYVWAGKPRFLGLLLPRLEPNPRLAIDDLYNIWAINVWNKHNMYININANN